MRFLRQTLGWLDGVYDFIGSKVRTDDVDLTAIQLVHDVGPNSEYASGRLRELKGEHAGNNYIGGSFVTLVSTASSLGPNYATGNNLFTLDPLTAIREAFPAFSLAIHDLWLLSCQGEPNPVNSRRQAMGFLPLVRGSEQGVLPPIRLWEQYNGAIVDFSGVSYPASIGFTTEDQTDSQFFHQQGAIRLELQANVSGNRDQLWWAFNATNLTGTFSGHWHCYISPKGVLPPGRIWWP